IGGLRLRIAGACTAADEPFVERLRRRLNDAGLAGEVEFLPNLDREEKIAFLRSLSALSVPATYGEAFGLYVIEALAAGLPVVQPRAASFPGLIEATGGGVLYEPGDVKSLADTVEGLLSDPERLRALGEAGRKSALQDFSAGRMAENIARVFGQVSSRPLETEGAFEI